MIKICSLFLGSYILGIFISESPYFYDSDLDELCLKEIKDSIVALCSPTNCIIVDPKIEENEIKNKKNQVVFVQFLGWLNKQYKYFLKGRKEIDNKSYSNTITEMNCQEVINEIVDEIEKTYKIRNFNIYFTIDILNNNTAFFNKDRVSSSISLIEKSFKNRMKHRFEVKYYPYDYEKYFKISNISFRFSNTKVSTFKDSEIVYYCFIIDSFYNKLFERLESSIRQYEEGIMNEIKKRYELQDGKTVDLFIASIFSNMHNSLEDDISMSQAKFLLRTWCILRNKKGFYDLFIDTFDKEMVRSEQNDLKKLVDVYIMDLRDVISDQVIINILLFHDPSSQAVYYYSVMDSLSTIDTDRNYLSKNSRIIISKIYKALTKNFENLAKIILFNNHENLPKFNDLRNEIFELYKRYTKDMIFKYIQYLEAHGEENWFFENLTNKCLEDISQIDKKGIVVQKDLNDTNLNEYVEAIERIYASIFRD